MRDTETIGGGLVGRLQKKRVSGLLDAITLPLFACRKGIADLTESIDIDKTRGVGLDLIGDIIGQPRVIPDAVYLQFFGYVGQVNITGYGQARYRQPGESPLGGSRALSDAEYVTVLKWRRVFIRSTGSRNDILLALKCLLGKVDGIKITSGSGRVNIDLPGWASGNSYLKTIGRFIPIAAGIECKVTLNGQEIEEK